MLLSTRRSLGAVSAAIAACSLPTLRHAQAEDATFTKAHGRIYVCTIYHVEQPTRADGAIIVVDPSTGEWQILIEKDATKGGAGDHVRLSPDRRSIVFARSRDGIWKSESDGQFPLKIFDQDDPSYQGILRPVWSPDGQHLVVTKGEYVKKDSQEVWQNKSWQIDTDGRNAVRVPIPDTEGVCDWSPDGQWFLTSSTRQHGQIYLMKTDGTHERRLTEGSGGNGEARFSSDGKKIVYLQRTREGTSIWAIDADGGNATKLVAEADLFVPTGAFWSPDGKQIAVIVFDWQIDENGQKRYPSLGKGKFRIEVMDADGTNRRPIPLKGETLPFISPMGDWR